MACRRTLMCKNHPVVEFIYDEEIHAVTKITGVPGREFAPVALFAPDSGHPITRRTLNDWWTGRAIPFTRDDMHRLKEGLGISSTMELLERGMGLSLSDRYWVKETGDPRGWSDVNFFDNPFGDELGRLTLGQTSSATLERSPNASLGGDLRKMWTVENGRRVLLKAGRGRANQEPYNEVIATELYQRVLEPGDFVPYDIEERGNAAYSRCPDMLGPDEELVPAWELRQCQPHPKNETLYACWIRTLRGLGLEGQLECVDKMLVCDYIIGNFDRHWNNFGLIRDTETREFKRVAPIFDSGNSLWCSTPRLDCPADYLYDLLPFLDREKNAARMFALLGDLSWLDPALRGLRRVRARGALKRTQSRRSLHRCRNPRGGQAYQNRRRPMAAQDATRISLSAARWVRESKAINNTHFVSSFAGNYRRIQAVIAPHA